MSNYRNGSRNIEYGYISELQQNSGGSPPPTQTPDLVYSQYTQSQWNEIITRYNSNLYFDANNPISNLPDTKFQLLLAQQNVFRNATQGQTGFDPDTQLPDDPDCVWGDGDPATQLNLVNYTDITETNPNNTKPIYLTSGAFFHNGLNRSSSLTGVSIPGDTRGGEVWPESGSVGAKGGGRTGGRMVAYLVEAILIYETATFNSTAYNNAVTRINYIKDFFNQQIAVDFTKADFLTGGTPAWIPGYINGLDTGLGTGIRTGQWFTIFLWLRPFLNASEEANMLVWLKNWAKFFIENFVESLNVRNDFNNLQPNDYVSDSAILSKVLTNSDELDNTDAIYEPWLGYISAGRGATAFQLYRLTNRDLVGISWAGEMGYWLKKYYPSDPDADYLWQGGALRFKMEFLFQMLPYTDNGENSIARIEFQRQADSSDSNATHYSSFVTGDLVNLAEAEKKYVGTTTLYDYNTVNGFNFNASDNSRLIKTSSSQGEMTKSLYNWMVELTKYFRGQIDLRGTNNGSAIIDDTTRNGRIRRYAFPYYAKANTHYKDSFFEDVYKGNITDLEYPSPSNLASAAVFNMALGLMAREPIVIPAWYDMESLF